MKESKLRIDFRTFFILMLVGAIPMVVGTWWLFNSYQDAYQELAGLHLSDTAETAFSMVSSYLQDQIIAVAGLTEIPSLRDQVTIGNQDLKRNLDEVRKSIPRIGAAWPKLDRESPEVKAILENAGSKFLRRYTQVNKSYREIVVTDFLGRLVATSSRSVPYYRAQDEWWKETYGDGQRGSVYIGDVHYDAGAHSYLMDLAQPFVETDGGVIGVIKVVLDTQDINSLLGSIQGGSDTSISLIHAKGDVISAPGYSVLQQTTYPATLEILNSREKNRRFFISTALPGSIVGLTQRSFPQMYPHLNWIVFSTAKTKDLLGPLPELRMYLLALLLSVFLLVLIATIMLSRVESKPVIEEDPHLERL
ncbi:MAG TPA: cache domain-containing protein [Acidobacteriota bacterium]|nr:cache domain-containing protein [Acidobacteriota bacterium]